MRAAFSDALVAAAVADPKVVLLTGDHGYALFDAFRKARPDQYINCGIAEQNMVGVAAGLAKAGFRPIVYGLAAFVPIRTLEQIKMDVCYEGLPVVLIGDGAGFVYSHLGSSHQSTEDIAATRGIPGLTVLSPADRFEMTATMDLSLRLASPVYLRVGKSDRGDVHQAPVAIEAGQLLRIRKGAGRAALLATGSMVRAALDVAERVDAEVWSVPCIKPVDEAVLSKIARSVGAIVTLEEHSILGGLGAAVAECLSARRGPPLLRIGVEDRFSQYCGTWDYLLQEHQLDTATLHQRVGDFLQQEGAGPAATARQQEARPC
jgi:transketolase